MSAWSGYAVFCRDCWALMRVDSPDCVWAKRRWFGLWRYYIKCAHCKSEVSVFALNIPPLFRREARRQS